MSEKQGGSAQLRAVPAGGAASAAADSPPEAGGPATGLTAP